MKHSQEINVNGSIQNVRITGTAIISPFYGRIVFLENTGTAIQERDMREVK